MYEDLQKYEGCLAAIWRRRLRKKNSWALRFIPFEFRTIEVYLEAIATGTDGDIGLETIIESVPKVWKTSKFYLEAIKRNGYILKDIPEVMKSPEMCLMASIQDRFRFPDVPKEFLIYYETNPSYLRLRTWNWKKYVKISTEEELLEKCTQEELLTSTNAYLRKLGLEYKERPCNKCQSWAIL